MSRLDSRGQIRRYEMALYDLKKMDGQSINSEKFCRKHKVSDEFILACKRKGVIENRCARANWIKGVEVDLFLAQDIVKMAREIRHNRSAYNKGQPKKRPKMTRTPEVQPKKMSKSRALVNNQRSISILWGMISIKY